MQGAVATAIRGDYPRLALRTRARRHEQAACHTPGCRDRAAEGRSFCGSCQQTLDRVREELKAGSPRGRKPVVRKTA
jgi:hypothetical protein